jgi:hypothetical protein
MLISSYEVILQRWFLVTNIILKSNIFHALQHGVSECWCDEFLTYHLFNHSVTSLSNNSSSSSSSLVNRVLRQASSFFDIRNL